MGEKKCTNFIKSKYTLCIFTYFPFITTMEQLMTCMLDEIKISRVEHFSNTKLLETVTIDFLSTQLESLVKQARGALI